MRGPAHACDSQLGASRLPQRTTGSRSIRAGPPPSQRFTKRRQLHRPSAHGLGAHILSCLANGVSSWLRGRLFQDMFQVMGRAWALPSVRARAPLRAWQGSDHHQAGVPPSFHRPASPGPVGGSLSKAHSRGSLSRPTAAAGLPSSVARHRRRCYLGQVTVEAVSDRGPPARLVGSRPGRA